MKNNRKIENNIFCKLKMRIAFIMVFTMCLGCLTGCKGYHLADQNAQEASESEFLGVVVLKSPYDGVDKVYATRREVERDGYTDVEQVFDLPEVVGLFGFEETREDGQVFSYDSRDELNLISDYCLNIGVDGNNSDEFEDDKNHEASHQSENALTYNGTLYIDKDYLNDQESMSLHFYRIYRDEQGVYMNPEKVEGTLFFSDTPVNCTFTYSEDYKVNANVLKKCTIIFNVLEGYAADQVELVGLDKDGQVLNQIKYESEALPETIKLEKDCAGVVCKSIYNGVIKDMQYTEFNEEESEYVISVKTKSDILGYLCDKKITFEVE